MSEPDTLALGWDGDPMELFDEITLKEE